MVECKVSVDGEKKTVDLEVKKLNDFSYIVEKQEGMKVSLIIYANKELMENLKKDISICQGIHVCYLPGIKGRALMMPDAHQGYGFPIGGVAAIDAKEGCISPGGIGFDINCGVRLLYTNLKKGDVRGKIHDLLNSLFEEVPSGVGKKSDLRLSITQLNEVLNNGVEWAVKNGYGNEEDMENCESFGKLKQADASKVSDRAKKRGVGQLGTLGAGNHFLEVQYVNKIFNKEVANTWGIKEEGQVVVMIHCGSRGLGHQVCSDYLRKMEDAYPDIMASLPEKDLIYAPAGSKIAKDYFGAMSAAANYAWCNRHIIGHQVRKACEKIFPKIELHTIYDVAHNMAKLETHVIDGEEVEVYIHRKGATRAFGPGNKELSEKYQKTGQPIMIPGSMGTSSYLLVGTEEGMKESFGSTAHGAGRLMSRKQASKQFRGEQVKKELAEEQIFVKAASWKGVSEEAPLAYKDVDDVVEVSDKAGIGKIVAQFKPMGVVKG